MSALSEQARSKARSKVERLTRASSSDVDASGWREPTDEKADVQTGMRPLSRRAFKRGGKVRGEPAKSHAGRKPRKSGGALTADSLINRNVKDANAEREGEKHIGGLKRGGRAGKLGGGMCGGAEMPMSRPPGMRPMMRAAGGRAHDTRCNCEKCSGGRVGKAKGGALDGTLQGMRPEGGRLARKSGGSAKKGMNVNIIIAPGGGQKSPMPAPGVSPPGAGPVGLHQGAPPPAMMPPGAPAPMGPAGMPPPQMRKRGGRAYPIESGAGGGLGRLEKIQAYG